MLNAIRKAERAAAAKKNHHHHGRGSGTTGPSSSGGGGNRNGPIDINRIIVPAKVHSSGGGGVLRQLLGWAAPASATSIPTPLLVLTGLALVLMVGALAAFVSRRIQARRAR